MFHKIKLCAAVMVSMLCISSCSFFDTGKQQPEKVLSEYVARTFTIKKPSEKSQLLELATGEVKTAIENLDEQGFKKYFTDAKKEFVSLKIKDERKISNDKYSITYEVSYIDKTRNTEAPANAQDNIDRVTNKKHAIFVQENGKWLIAEVQNLKTFIEHENEMSF